jgi:NAD+ synthase
MIALFDFAKANRCLVLGTENKSEQYLGYFTRFGDEASDIEPIRNLYKTEVFQLAKFLSMPEPILLKAPTAGLWAGQTDEGQFGFSYKEADEILYQLYDLKKTEEEIEKSSISHETIEKVKTWVSSVSFKHHLPHMPPEPEIVIK